VADHLVPNQILGFFEFQGEREREVFLFSRACRSSSRRRFKEIEDAPFAAYGYAQDKFIQESFSNAWPLGR
jgi:hypothetical protein